jgi:hypothetical protein
VLHTRKQIEGSDVVAFQSNSMRKNVPWHTAFKLVVHGLKFKPCTTNLNFICKKEKIVLVLKWLGFRRSKRWRHGLK